MQARRISTRSLMILTAVVAVDVAVLIQSASLGFGIEFPLFIASDLVTINMFFASYLKATDRMNAAPPERQTEMVLTLGCLVLILMVLLIPIVFVVLMRGRI
jgi:heme/copper-type cytochrome/quinol oxidase subunit 3